MKVTSPLLTACLSLLLIGLAGMGCSDSRPTSSSQADKPVPSGHRPSLVFFRIPRCFLCDQLADVVAAQEKDHRSQMDFRILDYHLPSCQESIHQYQLGSHGIVISGPQGNKLWSLAAHQDAETEDLVTAIKGAIGQK